MPPVTAAARWETLGGAAEPVRAFVAGTLDAGTGAAMIVLPAIHGPNAYAQGVAQDLAAAGCPAVLIDIFSHGAVPDLSSPDAIRQAVADVDDTRVLASVATAIRHVKATAGESTRIGVIGFCIGGTHALLAASEVPGVDAAVAYYGMLRYPQRTGNKPQAPMERVAQLRAPVLYHVGDNDPWVDAATLDAYVAALREHKAVHEVAVHRGAGHAFHEHHKPSYRPVAARASWASSLVFLDWYLKGQRTA